MRVLLILLACLCILTQAQQLDKRVPQANENPSASQEPNPQPTSSSNPPQPSGSNSRNSSVQTALPSSANNNNNNNNNQNNTLSNLPTSASYGNSIYAAGASFLTPTASKSVAPLYRIDNKENVTFVWEFTNLLVRPVNLTLAAVAPNKVTYTITALQGAATSAVWQIKDVPAASPLMMGFYQIQLYDQRGPSAAYQPGWLAPVSRLSIAFYSPESYQPGSGADWCPYCFYSASKRLSESMGAYAVAIGVAMVTSGLIICGLLY